MSSLRPLFVGLLVLLEALSLNTRALAETGAQEATAAPDVVLVIDGSGSMWGALGGSRKPKIEAAQAALRAGLEGLSPASRVGLVSFGHRRRADCSDVELVAPIEAGAPERVLALSDKLNPKGKGPLTSALREAGKRLAPGAKAAIIVVHDGPDNCSLDPCAAAAEIVKANPRVTIHDLALGIERSDLGRVSCIAKAGNGRFFDIEDEASLTTSLGEALRLAGLDAGGEAAIALPGPPKTGVPGLRLWAVFSESGPAQNLPFRWHIARRETPDEHILDRRAPDVAIDVPPGAYIVDVSLGALKAQRLIEVGAGGPTMARISLEAGTLKLDARTTKGGALANPILTITKAAKDFAEPGHVGGGQGGDAVWIGRDPAAELVLPKGPYIVHVEDGLAARDSEVTVSAGGTATTELALSTGLLELSAEGTGGADLTQDVVYSLSVDDPDAPQGRREIVRSADPRPVFTVPAGTYYVVARAGVAEVRDRIAVGTGDDVKHVLKFDVATLTAVVDIPADVSTVGDVISIRVFKADDARREIARGTGREATFLLPPQKYRLEARLGEENVRADATVDLVAGKVERVPLRLDIAELRVTPRSAAARGEPVFWRVKDETGRTVMHSGSNAPHRARLAPGKYVLQSDMGSETQEQALELRASEVRTVVAQ